MWRTLPATPISFPRLGADAIRSRLRDQGGASDPRLRPVRESARPRAVRRACRALAAAGSGRDDPSRPDPRLALRQSRLRLLLRVRVFRPGRLEGRAGRSDGSGRGRARSRDPVRGLLRGARVTPEPDYPQPRPPDELGFERIRYEKAPPRATITLDRPEVLNAFDFRMLRELARACEDASWDDEIRVVVLTGAGRAFCVGADLKSWAQDYLGNPREYWKWFGAFKDAHDKLREIGKPTLARINGICVGGGNELQMACDLAVMVDDAYIRHVGLEHGSVPAGGATQWLPIMVGERRAREIVMLCEEIPAARAAEWGLVNHAVPAAELDANVDEYVEKLARKLPQTTRYAKQQLNWWRDLSWHDTVGHARDWLALSMLGDEAQEAVKAFLNRK